MNQRTSDLRLRHFKRPFKFQWDITGGPEIVDATGYTVAKVFWPCHEGSIAETESAEIETEAVARAMAGIFA